MRFFIVDHVFVYFIGDGEAVVFTAEISNLLKFVYVKNLAEWIVWGVYDNRLCVGRERRLEFRIIVGKTDSAIGCGCLLQCDIDGFRARDDCVGSVVFIKGFKDDNLVTGIDNCEECREHTFG